MGGRESRMVRIRRAGCSEKMGECSMMQCRSLTVVVEQIRSPSKPWRSSRVPRAGVESPLPPLCASLLAPMISRRPGLSRIAAASNAFDRSSSRFLGRGRTCGWPVSGVRVGTERLCSGRSLSSAIWPVMQRSIPSPQAAPSPWNNERGDDDQVTHGRPRAHDGGRLLGWATETLAAAARARGSEGKEGPGERPNFKLCRSGRRSEGTHSHTLRAIFVVACSSLSRLDLLPEH